MIVQRMLRAGGLLIVTAMLIVFSFWWYSCLALHPQAQAAGTISLSGLQQPVTIVRDRRGVPRIHARNLHDLYMAQGYAVGQDRLFQLDIMRRYVAGELAEIFGSGALQSDISHRRIRPRELAHRIYGGLAPSDRAALEAYAAGVNAAMEEETLPVEFRLLLYRPQPWTSEDSILTALGTEMDLTNDWDSILTRERFNRAIGRHGVEELEPVSDPAYDVPMAGGSAAVSCNPPVHASPPHFTVSQEMPLASSSASRPEASNAWAVGGGHTVDGHALVANDPHLDYSEPGPWYLVELQAPGLHVIGATLPGTPGVLLGHNDRLAWGATTANVSTVTVYRDPLEDAHPVAREQINVRFGNPVLVDERVTAHGFVVAEDPHAVYTAEWVTDREARSALGAFLALDRAGSIDEALTTLSRFPGPPLNIVLGDTDGRVAYHMVGFIPNDSVWSRYVVPGRGVADTWHNYVPFDQLPHVDPSRDRIVYAANNRVYGSPYAYRLTDFFIPPYRAYRIHDVLESGGPFDVVDMQRLQSDQLSLPESEFARGMADYLGHKENPSEDEQVIAWSLAGWDGRMSPESHAATLVHDLLDKALARYAALVLGDQLGPIWRKNVGEPEATASMLCALRSHAVTYRQLFAPFASYDAPQPWGQAGVISIHHLLHAMGITVYDPPVLTGNGDFATVRVQTPRYGQSFRAVWDVGSWNRGGIIIPLGESGRPGTPHVDDQQQAFSEGRLLPFIQAWGRDDNVLRLMP